MKQGKAGHQPGSQRITRESLNLAKEIRTIQQRAADQDSRIVRIGPLMFFSTQTGDAWMLEPEDHLAVRLAVGGDPLPVLIEETKDRFAIGWQGRFARILIAGIEVMHMIRKCQLSGFKDPVSSAANQFYSLAF